MLALTLACSSDSESDGGGGSGGGATGDPACPESGSCQADDCSATASGCRWDCESEYICDKATFRAPGETTSKPYTLDDPAAATCVLTALRDSTPGSVIWAASSEWQAGMFSKGTRLHIRPGRVVLAEQFENADSPVSASKRGPSVLAAPSVFDACLTETDPDLIWDCLQGWEDHCGVP